MCQYYNLLKLNNVDNPVEGWKVFRVLEKMGVTFLLSAFQGGPFWTPGVVRTACEKPSPSVFALSNNGPEEVSAGFFHAFFRKEDAEKYMKSIKDINGNVNLVVKKVRIPVETPYYRGITYTLNGGSELVVGLDSFASQYLEIVE